MADVKSLEEQELLKTRCEYTGESRNSFSLHRIHQLIAVRGVACSSWPHEQLLRNHDSGLFGWVMDLVVVIELSAAAEAVKYIHVSNG